MEKVKEECRDARRLNWIPPGREGLFNLIKSVPAILRYEPGVIAADGDFVIVHGRFTGMGLPANWIAADIVRIENGIYVEHWDVIQDEATEEQSKSKAPMFASSFPVRPHTHARTMGAVLYIRVSTPEQAKQQYNIPTQQRKVEDWRKQQNLRVLRLFIDRESARTSDRTEFQKMLDYCRVHRGKVSQLVVADFSRLARNVIDQSTTIATLKQQGIAVVSVDEPITDETAAGEACTKHAWRNESIFL